MKAKRWLAMFVAGCMGIGSLAGCGSAPTGTTAGESGSAAGAQAEETSGGGVKPYLCRR